MWWRKKRTWSYLSEGRLADVLALIQVLALDVHTHRSDTGLLSELQGPPRSAETWPKVAEHHPEFFRVKPAGENRVSLIARHVTPKENDGGRPSLPSDYTSKLLQLAVELHDREVRRSQYWQVWVPVIVAITAGAFTLFGVCLKSWMGGNP